MTTTTRGILIGLCAISSTITLAAQQMPQTTTQKIAGKAIVTTEQLKGSVLQVEDNTLIVRMSTGEIRHFNVPESRKFLVDGKELNVHQLKPGTKLTATITTTTTPITERTVTVGTGKVFYVAGNTVILTLPNNENRMYKVQDSYQFNIGGQKATVFDLRKGMVVSAEKIVEEPKTEIAANAVIVGQAPPEPKPTVAATPAPKPTPAPVQVAERVAEPVAAPAPPVEQPAPAPAELPKTGSPFPLMGAIGLLLTGASLAVRKLRSF